MPVVWAEGERSWYEIEPSLAYSSTAKQMFHAIALQFAIVDEYEEGLEKFKNHRKKANRSKTMRDVDIPLETLLFRVRAPLPSTLVYFTYLCVVCPLYGRWHYTGGSPGAVSR